MKPAQRLSILLALLLTCPVLAQDGVRDVALKARDGLTLVGTWVQVSADSPTVILLHQLYSNRQGWSPIIETLTANGYNVLAVDLRGYGQTRGRINWPKALLDVADWAAWVRGQGVRDAISMLGSSMGSVLAIVACGADPACKTAIAISPGWEYYGIGVRVPLTEQFGERRVLVIYAERDRYPRQGVPRMVEAAPNVVTTLSYLGNAHGIDMIRQTSDTSLPAILDWLAAHGQ
ncbi:MAG: alpha/beta fold hydrolase [Anaerolineae bacterium]|nr:alpha/beta fold hydrolase [Anaerolineae bacterium]MDW8172342.1 alpha/beta hydrolase [Anaerolineae bacterium]